MLELLHLTRLAYLVELELRKASQAQESSLSRPCFAPKPDSTTRATFFGSLLRSAETTISIINTSNTISNMRLDLFAYMLVADLARKVAPEPRIGAPCRACSRPSLVRTAH